MPLITVICLCYNHARFVVEAIESVLNQSYKKIQVIVIDDASTDNSAEIIHGIVKDQADILFIPLSENVGNCKAFNTALKEAKGDFIIDFATDDVMLPDRLEKQVNLFQALDESYGVVFTDAMYIDDKGEFLSNHNESLRSKGLMVDVPQGDVYRDVLTRYFISSPTMMIKREVFDRLNGYDENLSYEDYDFWVRSARYYKYGFLDQRLTKVRKSEKSMSTGWYKKGDSQLHSTYQVCKKAILLNRDEKDNQALKHRVRYELRQSVFSDNREEAELFFNLLKELGAISLTDNLLLLTNRLNVPLSWLRRLYHRLRYS